MSLPTLPTHPKPSLVEGKYMDIKARCAKREVRKAQSEEATLLMDQLGHEFNSDDFILDFVGIRGMQDGRWVGESIGGKMLGGFKLNSHIYWSRFYIFILLRAVDNNEWENVSDAAEFAEGADVAEDAGDAEVVQEEESVNIVKE
ncbi:hypothetical protein PV328_001042 [Microctonus aethiopoides]|uniref:Uncharacterized protein n=1 Tax=Microctonus aethiopoides TaxID=144406 RepID=A0AA39FXC0_9HYME|nr:hypothetical protein PV328_001042 [Microctonus aethiopoides]